jgi:isoleucyl-tRNA synthetase
VAATDYRAEMTVSDEFFKRIADSYRRIRNTSRFLLANMSGFEPDQHSVSPADMLPLDRWAVERAWQLQEEIIEAYNKYEFHHIYQKVHNFCAVDMGGFYLDVIKDRQYTTKPDSLARRSAQTALYHVMEAMVRWLAPITSFTAEEIWQHLPGERGESIFLETWYQFPAIKGEDKMGLAFWAQVLEVRQAVAKQLEALRVAGGIGSSLDAEVDLHCGSELFEQLAMLEDELRFVLLTSYARIHKVETPPADAEHVTLTSNDEMWIQVSPCAYEKCVRCWHHREDVGSHSDHPELCGRCVDNVEGNGETRHYA